MPTLVRTFQLAIVLFFVLSFGFAFVRATMDGNGQAALITAIPLAVYLALVDAIRKDDSR